MLNYSGKENFTNLSNAAKKKHRSKQRILRHLSLFGDSTCNDIARHIKLSIPSVQSSINELINERDSEALIEVKGQKQSSGGRPPSIYGLSKDSFYVLCIDVGRYNLRLAILNCHMGLYTDVVVHDISFQDDFTYLEEICTYADNLILESKIDSKKILGIGIDMPGAINSMEGINYSYFFKQNETLANRLEKRFNLPVFLENDANVYALAELWYGHARGKKNAMVLLLSWGIGLGLIINGKIYLGSSGFAGEFSHIPAKENGDLCWCNKQGCLETVASSSALNAIAKKGLAAGVATSLSESIENGKVIQTELIIAAANHGDQFAVNILSEVGIELGKGISTLIQILNPEIVILGGKMSKAKQYLITPIRQALNSHCNPLLTNDLKIEVSDFDEEAALVGSAINVVDKLFSKSQ